MIENNFLLWKEARTRLESFREELGPVTAQIEARIVQADAFSDLDLSDLDLSGVPKEACLAVIAYLGPMLK